MDQQSSKKYFWVKNNVGSFYLEWKSSLHFPENVLYRTDMSCIPARYSWLVTKMLCGDDQLEKVE